MSCLFSSDTLCMSKGCARARDGKSLVWKWSFCTARRVFRSKCFNLRLVVVAPCCLTCRELEPVVLGCGMRQQQQQQKTAPIQYEQWLGAPWFDIATPERRCCVAVAPNRLCLPAENGAREKENKRRKIKITIIRQMVWRWSTLFFLAKKKDSMQTETIQEFAQIALPQKVRENCPSGFSSGVTKHRAFFSIHLQYVLGFFFSCYLALLLFV